MSVSLYKELFILQHIEQLFVVYLMLRDSRTRRCVWMFGLRVFADVVGAVLLIHEVHEAD